MEPEFERLGLGYRLTESESSVDIRIDHVKRSSGELSADIAIRCNLAGVKTAKDGILHVGRMNLTAVRTRESLAKYLSTRTPGFDIDWHFLMEMLVIEVMDAEREGSPIEMAGTSPVLSRAASYVVDPIIRKDAVSLLYGPGGAGKSVLALACALSVAAGREIVPGIAPAVKGNVMYLDWETDRETVNERIAYIAAGHGFDAPNIFYRRCTRPISDDAIFLASAIKDNGIVLVVVDSAAMAMGSGSEHSDASDSTLNLFWSLRTLGTTVQLVDHVSKAELSVAGKTRGKMPYGSIFKVNLARAAWEVRNTTDAGDDSVSMSLIHTKANDAALHAPMGFNIVFGNQSIRFSGAAIAVGAPMTLADRIADLLEGGDMPLNEIAEEMDVSEPRARTAMRDDKRFKEDKFGSGWALRHLSVAR